MFSPRQFIASLVLCVAVVANVAAQKVTITQPTVWAQKPDVAAFEKIINDRLAAAQQSIDTLVAVKGPRTIDNTLGPFDEAVRQISSAAYLAGLMQQVHPEATFRDHATAMLTKASAAQTAVSLNQ